MEINYKSLDLSVKDVDTKSGIVTGYFAAFDNVDSYGDMIVKGAFKKTIQERGPEGTKQIKHLFQHDSFKPIGLVTMLKEDKKGLYFESVMSKTKLGQDTLLQYAEGIYNEHSIGYRTMKSERVEDGKGNWLYWKLTEIKLWEGSTVTWGANSETPFTGFKSENREDKIAYLDRKRDNLIKTLRIGELSDETLEAAEMELLKITEAYKSLSTPEPIITHEPTRLDSLKSIAELLKNI